MYDPGGIRGVFVDRNHRCDSPHSLAARAGITGKDMRKAGEPAVAEMGGLA
ncbi:hypothetical protein KAX17_16510 [Candidatus Bipolaricaulota bacterium]|nr:hypothetical protein [Candidatus Bipolaricaulota bacterium]